MSKAGAGVAPKRSASAAAADGVAYGCVTVEMMTAPSWDALIGGYLTGRRSLGAVVLLMDARHPLTANDRQFLEWLRPVQAARLVLLSGGTRRARKAGVWCQSVP